MEIQVENHGSEVDLKFVLVWVLLSHVGFQTWYQFFILKVVSICTYTFLTISFLRNHCMHFLFGFSIAKGLATCRLGGVISAQKVLF